MFQDREGEDLEDFIQKLPYSQAFHLYYAQNTICQFYSCYNSAVSVYTHNQSAVAPSTAFTLRLLCNVSVSKIFRF